MEGSGAALDGSAEEEEEEEEEGVLERTSLAALLTHAGWLASVRASLMGCERGGDEGEKTIGFSEEETMSRSEKGCVLTLNSRRNRMHGSSAADEGAEGLSLAGGGAGSERTSRVRGAHATNACKTQLAKHTLVELVRPRGLSGASAAAASVLSRCADAACNKAPPGASRGNEPQRNTFESTTVVQGK